MLFVDTFTRWFDPENARAAQAVLAAAGIAAPAASDGNRPLCCGRTFLAEGLVDQARAEMRRLVAALKPHAQAGRAIVGLEPSCLFTLRDELLAVLPGADSELVASRAVLFEEFLAAEAKAGRLDLKLKPATKPRALLHGHCHQKAFGAMGAVESTLKLVPGLEVETIVSSCCGMAGSFGYEAEHHDVSMKMAEAALLPAVRAAGDDAILVADGFSCRHQIRDGASREAIHVARVLADALA